MALVLNHSRARGTDKVVLLGIANHDGDGGAWPSLATLARYANVDERSVRRSIASLVALGELAVEVNAGGTGATRGDRRPNLYRILVTADGGTPASSRDGADGRTPTSLRGDAYVTHGRTPTSPEPSIEPSDNRPPPLTPPDGFAEFWAAYPRRAGRRAAEAAWTRAVARAKVAPAVIVAAAAAYRDDPNREDAYTAHPATWLNQDRWDDEPLPARPGRAPSATALYIDAADMFAGWDAPRAVEG